jgi:large subunit ribosomal protein L15
MKYNELQISKHKAPKRVGRGIAAGQGKTAGRGTKGQNSRTGSSRRPGFEGGQNPLLQRLPKLRGFTSHRAKVETVYTGQLDAIKGKTIGNNELAEAGLVSDAFVSTKLIVKGEITSAKTVSLQGASVQAIAAVEKAGGSVTIVARQGQTKTVERQSRKAKAETKKELKKD